MPSDPERRRYAQPIAAATTAPCPCTTCTSARQYPHRRTSRLHTYRLTYTYTGRLPDGTLRPGCPSTGVVEAVSPLQARSKLVTMVEALGHRDVEIGTITLAEG